MTGDRNEDWRHHLAHPEAVCICPACRAAWRAYDWWTFQLEWQDESPVSVRAFVGRIGGRA